MSKTRTVYPVEGVYLADVPHVEHDCTDPRCVESGAFTTTKPAPAEPDTEEES
jgi:hypothetical protein